MKKFNRNFYTNSYYSKLISENSTKYERNGYFFQGSNFYWKSPNFKSFVWPAQSLIPRSPGKNVLRKNKSLNY